MLNVIKTAVITIIISFISGLLLDYYKNLAPRILCNIKNAAPKRINGRKICEYIVTVSNVSKKTIHELSLNIQSLQNSLKITDAKITKGLKFDSSVKDKIIDIHIPFLSKGDKFSVIVCIENQRAVNAKPIVVLRSPENFKRINSIYQIGILSSLFKRRQNTGQAMANSTNRSPIENKRISGKPGISKKALLSIVSIMLVVIVGIMVKSYFKGLPSNTRTPAVNTNTSKQSTDSSGSSYGNTGNTNSKTSQTDKSENKGTKASKTGSYGNTDSKSSTGNSGTKTPETKSSGNSDTNKTPADSSGNSDKGTQTGDSSGTSGNSDTKTQTQTTGSSSGSSGNSDTQTPPSSSGNTGN